MFMLIFDCYNNNNCFSDCRVTWHHWWRGKVSAEPLQTAMKLSFQNWIAFLSMLWRCLFGGASWEVMPEACIDSLYFSDISLSKMLCFGFNPQRRIRVRAC